MAMENPHLQYGSTSSTGPFSIAMLVYRRVESNKNDLDNFIFKVSFQMQLFLGIYTLFNVKFQGGGWGSLKHVLMEVDCSDHFPFHMGDF